MESEISSNDERGSTAELKSPTEQMFLLECQVKRVLISDPDLRLKLGTDDLILCENTRLTLTFMNYPEIELCENEDDEKRLFGCNTAEPTCGKSCLFALSEKQLLPFMNKSELPCTFAVLIRLYNHDSEVCGDSNSSLLIGCCAVPMGELFSEMLTQSCDIMDAPVTCVTRDDYPIKDITGTEIGSMFACVRISGFGKLILAPISVATSSKNEAVSDKMNFEMDKTQGMTEGSSELGPCGSSPIYREEITHGRFLPTDTGSEFISTSVSKTRCGAPPSETDWMEGFQGNDRSGSQELKGIGMDSIPEITEPEFTYEEIRAAVNGHTLFFKILKKGKSKDVKDAGKLPAVEGPVAGDTRSCAAARRCSKRDDAERKEDKNDRRPQQRPAERVPGPCGRGLRRSLQATEEKNGGYRVAVDPEWEKELKAEDNLASEGLVPVDEPKAGKNGREVSAVENPVRASKSKEVFSFSVGQQVMFDGEVRPKLVLEIRAPKTKEDLDEEEAAIDAAEDRQKRREDRKKASALVSDGTQYITSDFGAPEDSGDKKAGGKKGNKEAKGGKKGKKGKK